MYLILTIVKFYVDLFQCHAPISLGTTGRLEHARLPEQVCLLDLYKP